MNDLFPTYEIGSMPKLNARVEALRGGTISEKSMLELSEFARKAGLGQTTEFGQTKDLLSTLSRNGRKLAPEERDIIIDFNALLNLRLQEKAGVDYVYDGEGRRGEMYFNVARQIDGFEPLPEWIRSRGPHSWRKSVCTAEPTLKSLEDLPIVREFEFVALHARNPVKVPIDEPYMVAVMTDNRFYTELFKAYYDSRPRELRYHAKRALNLALARNIIRPQVEAVVKSGAKWVQLDAPAATIDIEHIPIMIEGVNAVVEGIDGVKFSLHMCYPRRVSLTDKSGYELLFPDLLKLDSRVGHLSLELANGDQYERDLAPFVRYQDQRRFEIGLGVVDITREKQEIETPGLVRDRVVRAAKILKDPGLITIAPDCGGRQLHLDRLLQLYDSMVQGAYFARKG